MTFRVVMQALAEAEIADAAEWYEEQSAGVGRRFLAEVRRCTLALSESPFRWPIHYKNARRHVMSDFPYLIYYEVVDDMVRIVRVVHGSRDPARIQNSLE